MLLYLHLVLSFLKTNQTLGIKSSVLREHLAIQRSSENIDPEEIVDGILLDKRAIRTINNDYLIIIIYITIISTFLHALQLLYHHAIVGY